MPARDKQLEKEVREWIEVVLEKKLPPGDIEDVLKDGIILCNLINKIKPGSVTKIATTGGKFKLMENIERYQQAVKKYGLPEEEIFQTVDLVDRRNVDQVVLSIYALGRLTQKHPEWTGPTLGPKMAEQRVREFTDEQLRSSEGHIGLQAGYNKGASQAGHGGFGNTRHM